MFKMVVQNGLSIQLYRTRRKRKSTNSKLKNEPGLNHNKQTSPKEGFKEGLPLKRNRAYLWSMRQSLLQNNKKIIITKSQLADVCLGREDKYVPRIHHVVTPPLMKRLPE